ncbi:hypothetical protein STEG23_005704 [Scotinomys teguina]
MELFKGKHESETKFGKLQGRLLWSAEKRNGKALAASWDSGKLMDQWVLFVSWKQGTSRRPADPGEGETVLPEDLLPRRTPKQQLQPREEKAAWEGPRYAQRTIKVTGSDESRMSKKDTEW